MNNGSPKEWGQRPPGYPVADIDATPPAAPVEIPGAELPEALPVPVPGEIAAADPTLDAQRQQSVGRLGSLARRVWAATRTFATDTREVWGSARAEVSGGSAAKNIGRLSLLGMNTTGILMEQFFVNETVLGMVAGHTLDGNEGLSGTLATAATTGGTSFIIQAGLGITTALSLKQFPGTMATIRGKLGKDSSPTEPDNDGTQILPKAGEMPSRSIKSRAGTAFVLGTSLVTIGRNAKHELSTAQNVRDVLGDAALVGVSVTALAGVVAGIVNTLRINELQDTMAETIGNGTVDVLTSPFTYLGVFVAVHTLGALKKKPETSAENADSPS